MESQFTWIPYLHSHLRVHYRGLNAAGNAIIAQFVFQIRRPIPVGFLLRVNHDCIRLAQSSGLVLLWFPPGRFFPQW